jgi:tRNA pseudouridine13 synthase
VLTFTPTPETFVVEEIPAYEPSGEGEHTFLWIEKRGLTTLEAIRRLAAALGVDGRDVGHAGLKDRHALTRQWLSVPRVDPEQARGVGTPELAVLAAARHGNKLRVGHLRGNRFEVVLVEVGAEEETGTGTATDTDTDVATLQMRLEMMAREGVPNYYGEQRFGAAGDNARVGLEILRGTRRERDHRRRRLLLSAAQAAVFNEALRIRQATGSLKLVRAGDVLQKVASGGLFVTEDVATDQRRVEAGEVIPTGPLPGTREKEPPPGTAARALEDEALAAAGATREDFARAGRDLPGARRPVLVPLTLGDPPVAAEPAPAGRRAFRLRFTLPAGSFATVVVTALTGPDAGGAAPASSTVE